MITKEILDIRAITMIYNDGKKEDLSICKHDNNMFYEVEEFIRSIKNKSTAQEHNQYSLMQLSIMDEVRAQLNMPFPADMQFRGSA